MSAYRFWRAAVLPSQISYVRGEAVAVIVKQRTRSKVFTGARYSGHSFRVGFVTSAAMADVPIWKIKAQTGRASDTALGRYIRSGELFGNAMSTVL
jgi:hypothetical protein